jgi:hypothetical protein
MSSRAPKTSSTSSALRYRVRIAAPQKSYLKHFEGQDHGCIRVDDFLAIRYTRGRETRAYQLKLTIPELAIILQNSAILDDPSRVLENIALLLYGDNDETQELEV